MIVKIKISSPQGGFTMMFGDSYKKWYIQLKEYCTTYKDLSFISADVCKDKWIGWGGLKWCNENEFQDELNREGCQDKEPDNPKPRQYNKMTFHPTQFITKKVKQIIDSATAQNEYIKKRNEEYKAQQLNKTAI